MAAVLAVAGCPPARHSGDKQEAASAPPPPAGDETAQAKPQAADDSNETAAPDEGSPPPQSETPPPSSFEDWELDGFRLGMSVAEARSLLTGNIQNYIQERWRYQDLTGMMLVGTYKAPIRMQGSLLFYDGKLVAIIANKIQDDITFKLRLDDLVKAYGPSLRHPPEFASGYRFMQKMEADKRQPDTQYMWADEPTQTLLVAGYYSEDVLATYMLIDASRYDLVAEAMEEIPPGKPAKAEEPVQQ